MFKGCFFLMLFIMPLTEVMASESQNSVMLYGGVGTSSPLHDYIQLKNVTFVPSGILSLGYNRILWSNQDWVSLEVESDLTKHTEAWDQWDLGLAFIVRFLRTPWTKTLGGSFGFGNGLSYATRINSIEAATPPTSNLLYYLLFEVAIGLGEDWEALFRIHHRSGAFGLFGNVVGGANYLCLGVKKRF